MEAEGINETTQIIRVVADGGERFYRVSGKVLGTAGHMVSSIGKMLAYLYRTARENQTNPQKLFRGEQYLTQVMKDAKRKGCSINAAQISQTSFNEFESYAADKKISYSVVDDSKGKVTIIYPEVYSDKIKGYIVSHQSTSQASSLYTLAQGASIQDINHKGDIYIDIYRQDISALDKERDLVYLKAYDNSITAVPVKDLQIKKKIDGSPEQITVRIRSSYIYGLYKDGTSRNVSSNELANSIYSYQKHKENALRQRLDYIKKNSVFLHDMDRKNVAILSNPRAHEKDIALLYRQTKYGSSGSLIEFCNKGERKVFIKKEQGTLVTAKSQIKPKSASIVRGLKK